MKKLLILCVLLTGCAAHRSVTGNALAASPVTKQEQLNVDNKQLAIHNRAIAKGIVAVFQTGFIEKEYFDKLSEEQIKLTRFHKQLTPLIASLSEAQKNSTTVKNLIDKIDEAISNSLASVIHVSNPQSRSNLQAEMIAFKAAADSIYALVGGGK